MMYSDLVGVPFEDGGRDKGGMDCWGLVMECFFRKGIVLPEYGISAEELLRISDKMASEESKWEKLTEPTDGCLVLIRTAEGAWENHVGIYIGDGRFIHAYPAAGVCISKISRWKSHIVGFYYPKEGG